MLVNEGLEKRMNVVFDRPEQIPSDFLQSCREMPLPKTVLMCPPDEFDVVDVKNPHMEGNIGKVNLTAARAQWHEVRDAFIASGASVELIEPVSGCEDMVFCANQTFVGLNGKDERVCLLSRMKHASRQREVAAFSQWFSQYGYRVETVDGEIGFEGSGDAIWHPGRALVWGGCGFRTQPEIYPQVSQYFDVPVIRLSLKSERFYHLDTCFCAIDEQTVLINAASIADDGLSMIKAVFKNVIECDEQESNYGMACNATALGGRYVIIQKGNEKAVEALRNLNYTVHEVDTSEYLKSGGSVFCMKMYVF